MAGRTARCHIECYKVGEPNSFADTSNHDIPAVAAPRAAEPSILQAY